MNFLSAILQFVNKRFCRTFSCAVVQWVAERRPVRLWDVRRCALCIVQHVDYLGPRELENVKDKGVGDDHPGLIVQGWVQDTPTAMTIACGASRTMLCLISYHEIPEARRPPLRSVKDKFRLANGMTETPMGVATMTVRLASHTEALDVLVFERLAAPISINSHAIPYWFAITNRLIVQKVESIIMKYEATLTAMDKWRLLIYWTIDG